MTRQPCTECISWYSMQVWTLHVCCVTPLFSFLLQKTDSGLLSIAKHTLVICFPFRLCLFSSRTVTFSLLLNHSRCFLCSIKYRPCFYRDETACAFFSITKLFTFSTLQNNTDCSFFLHFFSTKLTLLCYNTSNSLPVLIKWTQLWTMTSDTDFLQTESGVCDIATN